MGDVIPQIGYSTVELILGTAQFARDYGVLRKIRLHGEKSDPVEILEKSRLLGFGAIDTAPIYGTAEAVIGNFDTAQEIHTKIRPGKNFARSLKDSLRALKREKVELVYLHDSRLLHHLDSTARSALSALRNQGADSLGASVYDEEDFSLALNSGVFQVIQVPMSVIDNRFNGKILRAARSEGVKIYARSIFLQGILLASPSELPPSVMGLSSFIENFRRVCQDWEVDPVDALCRFVVERTEVDGVLVGVSDLPELERVHMALRASVPGELLDKIEALPQPTRALTDPRKWS